MSDLAKMKALVLLVQYFVRGLYVFMPQPCMTTSQGLCSLSGKADIRAFLSVRAAPLNTERL